MSLYFMETVPQTSRVNPAHRPRGNVFVSLPSVSFNFRGDLAVRDLLQQQGDKWYLPIEKQYDYSKLYKAIGKRSTMFNINAEIDLLGFGFRAGKGYVTFGISEHVASTVGLPSDLFKITERGFPNNSTLDFSPLRLQAMAYKQYLLGYSRPVNEKLTVGANLKALFGQVAVATDIRKFNLNTGDTEWSFDVEGDVYASMPVTVTNNPDKDFPEIEEQKDLEVKDYIQKYAMFSNPGFAIDLGASYRFDERLTVSAALNNLGFISWNQDLGGLTFQGNYPFRGINYDASTDDGDGPFDALVDSLETTIDYSGTEGKKFTTTLAPLLYVGGSYRLTPAISVSLLSRTAFWKKGVRQNFNLSLNLQPYSFVAFNIGINSQIKGNTYFGTGFSIYLGPLQFYLLSDYIPVRYSTVTINEDKIPFVPMRQKEVTFRTGLNLVFGRKGYVNRPMLD
jgi:hypothetical protein